MPELLEKSAHELDHLFRQSDAGEIPRGEAEGTVLIRPGTELAGPARVVIGVLRCVERPCFDGTLNKQIDETIKAKGRGKLEDLFASDDTWVVE